MNDQLQQQLQVLSRLYKESDHIYSSLGSEAGNDRHHLLGAVCHRAFRGADDSERFVQRLLFPRADHPFGNQQSA